MRCSSRRCTLYRTLVVAALVAAAPASAENSGSPELALDPVLRNIADALEKVSPKCSFVENTLVEELDSKKVPTAREVHRFRVELNGGQAKRTLLDVKKELGELNSRLRPKQDSELSDKEKEQRKNWRTPFHRAEQPKYRFQWAGTPKAGERAISFEPLKRDVEKGVGVARVDAETGQLIGYTSKPSKFPIYLSEFDTHMAFAETPCGQMLTRAEMTGEGGLLFFRARFHSITSLEGHALQ